MAPQRSASAPLPPFCSFLTKRGRVASAFVLRHVRTVCPVPTPSPRSLRSLPPSRSRRGDLYYHAYSLRPYPNPHPLPPLASLAAPLPLPAGGLNYIYYTKRIGNTQPRPHPPPARARPPAPLRKLRGVIGRTARCPPRRPGGLLITSSTTIPHIYCVSAPPRSRDAFLPLLGLPSACKPRYALACRQPHALAKVLRLRSPRQLP